MTRAALVLGLLLVAPAAFAQAPGETPPQAPGIAAQEDVMASRWAVGFSLGGINVSTESQSPTGFGLGELALCFRATPHLELELALAAGNSHDGNVDMPADQVRYGVLDLRYRFLPGHAWNWWLEAGLGDLAEFPKTPYPQLGTGGQSPQDAQRPLGELGIGLERRFHAFAVDAELRAFSIGPAKVDPPVLQQPIIVLNTMVSTGAPASAEQLTLGASYYF